MRPDLDNIYLFNNLLRMLHEGSGVLEECMDELKLNAHELDQLIDSPKFHLVHKLRFKISRLHLQTCAIELAHDAFAQLETLMKSDKPEVSRRACQAILAIANPTPPAEKINPFAKPGLKPAASGGAGQGSPKFTTLFITSGCSLPTSHSSFSIPNSTFLTKPRTPTYDDSIPDDHPTKFKLRPRPLPNPLIHSELYHLSDVSISTEFSLEVGGGQNLSFSLPQISNPESHVTKPRSPTYDHASTESSRALARLDNVPVGVGP